MKYLWTEDRNAGLHFWQLANHVMFHDELNVESKGSNQGILDAVREIDGESDDIYYIAFDQVFDNQDIRNKYLELREIAEKRPNQIVLLDMICFEYIILHFSKLIEWTGSGKLDKIAIRSDLLAAMENHRIDPGEIKDQKTMDYLKGFKKYSTERVLKSVVYELTENDMWSVRGERMGDCWYKDCCPAQGRSSKCGVGEINLGKKKFMELLNDEETRRVIQVI